MTTFERQLLNAMDCAHVTQSLYILEQLTLSAFIRLSFGINDRRRKWRMEGIIKDDRERDNRDSIKS